MELKSADDNEKKAAAISSNRTFMELKWSQTPIL